MEQYSYPKSVKASIKRITQPTGNHYECHVGTYTLTLLSTYFLSSMDYAITAEQIQDNNKKPDYIVEILEQDSTFRLHLCVEIKKYAASESIETIRRQVEMAIGDTIDDADGKLSCFAIIVKGINIWFYEYFSYIDGMDEIRVDNYNGWFFYNWYILPRN